MIIKRFLEPDILDAVKKDFEFFVDYIKNNEDMIGEYDLAIRENYLNIYYKGNSLAKISPKKGNIYVVDIHRKFISNNDGNMYNEFNRFNIKEKNKYVKFILDGKNTVHSFFQKENLLKIGRRIKSIGYSEELAFEQSLITDNQNRDDLIIIDRQVSDKTRKMGRIDLLALKKESVGSYSFRVIEVKLGNNNELKSDVVAQLNKYIKHIENNFAHYKKCYERHYLQKINLNLLYGKLPESININGDTNGIIVVGGYKQIAVRKIDDLNATITKSKKNIKVVKIFNEIKYP